MLPYLGPDSNGFDSYGLSGVETIAIDSSYNVWISGTLFTTYPFPAGVTGLAGVSGDSFVGLPPIISIVSHNASDMTMNASAGGTISADYSFVDPANGLHVGAFLTSDNIGSYFSIGSSPWYVTGPMALNATLSWAPSNIFITTPPQQIFANGHTYNLTSAAVYSGGGIYFVQQSWYTDPVTSLVAGYYQAATGGAPTLSWWCDVAGANGVVSSISGAYDPATGVQGVPAGFAVSFSAPAGSPSQGPPMISWNGFLLSFAYTDSQGTDYYADATGAYLAEVSSGDVVTVSDPTYSTAGSYAPGTKLFNFSSDPNMANFFAQDSNGDPIGLPVGVTLLFGASASGQSVLEANGTVVTGGTFTYRRPDGSWGLKYTTLPNGPFLVADASHNFTSPVYAFQSASGDTIVNGIAGWPATNLYPSRLYVNGVPCTLSTSSETDSGGAPPSRTGGAAYSAPGTVLSATLGWTWNTAFQGSVQISYTTGGSYSGTWDGLSGFSSLPSGFTVSTVAPSGGPQFGPPQISLGGVAFTFVAGASGVNNANGADVYQSAAGATIAINPDWTVTYTPTSGAQSTGTYNPVAGQFSFGNPSVSGMLADDGSGRVLNTALSGPVLWLKRDAGVATDASNNVTGWTDQSGIGNNASQTSASNRPKLVASAINGKPVVRFVGSSNQYLSLPNLLSGATAGEAMIVLRSTAGVSGGLWNFGGATYGSAYTLSNGTMYDSFGTGTVYQEGQPSQNVSQFHVYQVCSQSGSWESWIDGVPLFKSPTNSIWFASSPSLGKDGASDGFYGDIAEVVIYKRVLSAAERQELLAYLSQKYALSSPPATPTDLSAVAVSPTQNLISWDWQETNGPISYVIERALGASGTFIPIATVTGSGTYVDAAASAGQNYYYKIYAFTAAGASALSAETAVSAPMTEGGSISFSGMKLWLMADGAWESPVGYLIDYSGNGNDASQNTYGSRPTLASSVLNGKPALHFTGSPGQFLSLPNLLSGASAGEAMIVLRASPPSGASGALWNFGGVTYGSAYALNNGTVYDSFGSGSVYQEGQPSQDVTQFHVYQVSAQSGSWESWIDGVPLFRSTTNSLSFTGSPTLGKDGGSDYFYGDIPEVVIYNRVLSSSERQGLLTYFSKKYALASTPAAPTGVQALALNSTNALVTWNAPATNTAVSYVVWRKQDNDAWTQVSTVPGVRTFLDTALATSSTYSYEVQTIAGGNTSAMSAPVTLNRGLVVVNPLPTSGMALWLMADGAWESPVGYLADYSGNANDAWQTAHSQRPTLTPNAINGKPVLHFAGSSQQYLTLPNLLNGASAGDVMIVLRASPPSGTGSALWNFGGVSNGSGYPSSSGTLYDSFGSSSVYQQGQPAQNVTQFHVYEASSQSGAWASWIDGVSLFNSATNSVSFTSSPVLGKDGGSNYFYGDIAEVVVYNRALTTQERQTWQQYFALKYLLANFDPDGDGLTTGQALALGLDPLNAHASGNVLTNGTAVSLGLNPLIPITIFPNPSGPPSVNGNQTTVLPGSSPQVITLTSPAGVVLH